MSNTVESAYKSDDFDNGPDAFRVVGELPEGVINKTRPHVINDMYETIQVVDQDGRPEIVDITIDVKTRKRDNKLSAAHYKQRLATKQERDTLSDEELVLVNERRYNAGFTLWKLNERSSRSQSLVMNYGATASGSDPDDLQQYRNECRIAYKDAMTELAFASKTTQRDNSTWRDLGLWVEPVFRFVICDDNPYHEGASGSRRAACMQRLFLGLDALSEHFRQRG